MVLLWSEKYPHGYYTLKYQTIIDFLHFVYAQLGWKLRSPTLQIGWRLDIKITDFIQ